MTASAATNSMRHKYTVALTKTAKRYACLYLALNEFIPLRTGDYLIQQFAPSCGDDL